MSKQDFRKPQVPSLIYTLAQCSLDSLQCFMSETNVCSDLGLSLFSLFFFCFQQACVLRVSIHCDGCKQKVRKLLRKIEGKLSHFFFIIGCSGQFALSPSNSGVLKLTTGQPPVATRFGIFGFRRFRTCKLMEDKPNSSHCPMKSFIFCV